AAPRALRLQPRRRLHDLPGAPGPLPRGPRRRHRRPLPRRLAGPGPDARLPSARRLRRSRPQRPPGGAECPRRPDESARRPMPGRLRSNPPMTRLAGALLLLVAGCDTTIHQGLVPTADAPPTPPRLGADSHSHFPWIAANVFQTWGGNFVSCDEGGNPPGHLSLQPDRAFAQLVGIDSYTEPSWKRVVPGDPEHSYIMVKLGDVPGPLGASGTTMPPRSSLLCREKIDAIRRWIEAGAPEQGGGAADAPVHD